MDSHSLSPRALRPVLKHFERIFIIIVIVCLLCFGGLEKRCGVAYKLMIAAWCASCYMSSIERVSWSGRWWRVDGKVLVLKRSTERKFGGQDGTRIGSNLILSQGWSGFSSLGRTPSSFESIFFSQRERLVLVYSFHQFRFRTVIRVTIWWRTIADVASTKQNHQIQASELSLSDTLLDKLILNRPWFKLASSVVLVATCTNETPLLPLPNESKSK